MMAIFVAYLVHGMTIPGDHMNNECSKLHGHVDRNMGHTCILP